MKRMPACGLVAAAIVGLGLVAQSQIRGAAEEARPRLHAHNVSFSLNDPSEAARQEWP